MTTISVPAPAPWRQVIRTAFRVLTFRASEVELLDLNYRHLLFGLLCTWLVGIGRWWDDPGAHVLQHLGLGSVIYIFALSLLLWLVIAPLWPSYWSYRNVLTFVSLTSPPALLYAIPVERIWGVEAATTINVWFLGAVALWRLSLLSFYLARVGRMDAFRVAVGTVVPVILVIVTLAFLNLERAVFEIMAGLRERQPTANDAAYTVLVALTFLSVYGAIPLLIAYFVAIGKAWTSRE